ncbi:MAG: type IV pilus assembly protein PilM, partial [Candidatus Omnitrophota bacterium]|nr:type IV pilus assembly protein PilM [Candidatus Omnitrophota bacterium]
LSLSKLSAKRVNVSLSGQSVIVRYVEMPPMKREELKSAIKFEAEKYIPFDMKDAIVDCAVLDKSVSGSGNRVMLVAAKKDRVNSYLEMFKEAGMDVAAIDVDNMAVLNAFHRSGIESKQEGAYAIINIGARFSNMGIAVKAQPYFTRDILWGGADVSGRIKDSLGLSAGDAEALKRNPGERKAEVSASIMPTLEKFISEIRMSFDYFDTQFAKSVERLYISGGGSYLFNLREFLKEGLGIEVNQWDPLEGIEISADVSGEEVKNFPGQFSVAMGLALRSG